MSPERASPVVLSKTEVESILSEMVGAAAIVCRLAYLTGLRMAEVLRLRVRDVDIGAGRIAARDVEGTLLRRAILPRPVKVKLQRHLASVRHLHRQEVGEGHGYVGAPEATGARASKLSRAWEWQFVFPAETRWVDRRTGHRGLHHIQAGTIREELAAAASSARVHRRVTPSCLRHSLALHLLADGYTEEAVQKRLGLASRRMVRMYRKILDDGPDLA
jgi:integrase